MNNMVSIIRAGEEHAEVLSKIATQSFYESHGHSGPPADINAFAERTYNTETITSELADPQNIYHIIYYEGVAAGYSKIALNVSYPGSGNSLTKLDRLYLLKKYYDLRLGHALMEFIIDFARTNKQSGIWLYTWKKNERALRFYEKHGFKIIGSHDFRISENHSNPNHQMELKIEN